MAKISVVVPVYNAKENICACVESIQMQTFQDFEIVLVDDGSKDESGQICDDLAKEDARICVIHQQNQGVSMARNHGVEAAEGEYLVFVDVDDTIEPTMLSSLLAAYHGQQFVVAGYYEDIISQDGNRQKIIVYDQNIETCLDKEDAIYLYAKGLFSSVWGKIYLRQDILEHNIVFDKDCSLGEDAMFNMDYLQMACKGITVLNKPLYHYIRRDAESLDNKYNPQFAESQRKVFKKFLSITTRQKEKQIIQCYYFNALVVAIDNLYVNKDKLAADVYDARFEALCHNSEFQNIVRNLKGSKKILYTLRAFLICRVSYRIDYVLRETVKKVLDKV